MTGAQYCSNCGTRLKGDAQFCSSCGKPIVREVTPSAAPLPAEPISSPPGKRVMSRRAKIVYTILVLSLFALFLLTFARHLPGGAHPVIASQPEVEMGSTKPDQVLKPQPVTPEIRNGRISFPLSTLLEKRMIGFEYEYAGVTVPLIAFITGEGKMVTAVAICEPCNSRTFRIEGDELACGNCETRWKLNNLEGIQGSCQKYPPAPVPSAVVGNQVQIEEKLLKNWKLRI
jgi:FtrD-like iron-sulfur protein/zinc ribbon protein